jgi:hypothetical protein
MNLTLAVNAEALSADFFLKEPTLKQQVMTQFSVIEITENQLKRTERRMHNYQKSLNQPKEVVDEIEPILVQTPMHIEVKTNEVLLESLAVLHRTLFPC